MIKSFLIYFPGVLLSRITTFATVLIGAGLLDPTSFGYFSLIILIGEFSDSAMTNWSRITFTRLGSTSIGPSREFVVKMMRLTALCTLFAMILSVLTIAIVAPEKMLALSTAALAYVLAATIVRFAITIHQAAQNHAVASALEATRAVLAFVACVITMYLTDSAVMSSLAGAAANGTVGIFAMASGWRRSNSQTHNPVSMGAILAFGAPLIVLAFLSQGINSLDKFLLKGFSSAIELGYYAAAFTIARSGFDIVAGAFNIGTFVNLSMLFREGRIAEARAQIERQLVYILAIALPAAAVLVVARQTIGHALLPPAFQTTFIAVVPLVATGTILLNLKNFVFDNIFHIHLKNMLQIPGLLVGAAASFLTGLWLIPLLQPVGAAMMFPVGSFCALTVNLLFSSKLMRLVWPWRAMLVALIAALATALISAFIHNLFGGKFAFEELATQSVFALAAMLSSVLICNASLGTRNHSLAVAVILSDTKFVTGLSSYADSLIAALAQEPRRGKLVVFTNAAPSVLPIRIKHGVDVEWVQLPARIGPLPYKICGLLLHQTACLMALFKGCGFYLSTTPIGSPVPVLEQTVTLHDLYDFDRLYRRRQDVVFAHIVWRWLAWVSRCVICVSQSTRDEAMSFMPFATQKFVIIREASKYLPQKFFKRTAPRRSFLLVCNVQPTKNIECLIDALRVAEAEGNPLPVRWVGADPVGIVARLHELAPLPRSFIPLGRLSDAELQDEYCNALALVVPSWKEGFCLPVLEAHAFGTPVIAADIPVLNEVAGEGAIYFNPADPAELLAHMRKLSSNESLQRNLCRLAENNVERFSWGATARETLWLTTTQTDSLVAGA
jgi:glycosyltransferase involved in cell wall biosynthesis/O-antigen/teichoic acid export membrane protein